MMTFMGILLTTANMGSLQAWVSSALISLEFEYLRCEYRFPSLYCCILIFVTRIGAKSKVNCLLLQSNICIAEAERMPTVLVCTSPPVRISRKRRR